MTNQLGKTVGSHVTMMYRGEKLSGVVVSVNTPRDPKQYEFLTVQNTDGSFWPLEPLTWEVSAQ